MKYLLLFYLFLIPIVVNSQNKEDECPPGFTKKKDKEHWKCVPQEPLPVELLYFKGIQDNDSIILYWSTASELNNDYFIVEGSSNGITFSEVTLIHSDYTTANFQQYYKTKVKPYSYYRLIQVDFDSKRTYYQIIFVNFKKDNKSVKHIDLLGRRLN